MKQIDALCPPKPNVFDSATFTRDLRAAVGGGEVAVVRRADDDESYPGEVIRRIDRDTLGDYAAVAASLDWAGTDVVSIQHEYGIFGGPDGSHVLELVDALGAPAVSTLHTVLTHPSPSQRNILAALVERSRTTVVMSQAAASMHPAPRAGPATTASEGLSMRPISSISRWNCSSMT